MQKRIAVFGGTFDPIHIGHLIVAEMARQEYTFDKVIFMPTASSPHKKDRYISPQEHRFNMVSLALEDNPYFEVSDMELKRQGTSYTVDTLKALHTIYDSQWEIWMIIGGDMLLDIDTWKNVDDIIKMSNFAVYMRPDSSESECRAKAKMLQKQANTAIKFVHGPKIEISSTFIRQKMGQGDSIRYMVPARVEEYIKNKGLFT